MNQGIIDFGDFLHGVDLLESDLEIGDTEAAKGIIKRMMEMVGDARGTAANNLRYILYTGVDNWRPISIDELRAAVNALAVDYATAADAIVKQRSRKSGTASNQGNAAEKNITLRAAAAKRWKKKPKHSVNAVAKYLIENGKTTLKNRRVRDIIKDLKPAT